MGAPPVSASSPFAPKPAAPQQPIAVARPQGIKIEMSEEVVQAQKKGRKKVMVLAGFTAVVGMIIGWGIGGLSESNKGAQIALNGARTLTKEISDANTEVITLVETLKEAGKKVSEGEYPSAEVSKLGEINIPFEGTNLVGRGIGRFDSRLVVQLINYAAAVTTANDQKDKIRRLLAGGEKTITDLLEEREKPKVHWSVAVGRGPHGPMASMIPVPAAFLVTDKEKKDYSWPSELKIKEGKSESKFSLYEKGAPESGEYIPVDPRSQTSVCPNDTLRRMAIELNKMRTILEGEKTPGHETQGVIELGDAILDQLRKIGGPG